MIKDIKDQLERITSVMPQPSLKSRLSGAFFMNWEIRLAPHGAAPHTTFMMMMMMKKMMTLSLMTMMPITSLRLARCSLVTRGEDARKETIGGTWPTIVRLVLHYYDVCKLEKK